MSLRFDLPQALLALLGAVQLGSPAPAQCLEFQPGFSPPGISGAVYSLGTFDEGAGSALFVGGYFAHAAEVSANSIARWDGATWTALGPGLTQISPFGVESPGAVTVMRAFDDGSGPALFVGGRIDRAGGTYVNGVARWNGSSWSPAGGLGPRIPAAMAVYDDGTGPALFTAASTTGGGPALWKWDGANWVPIANFQGVNQFVTISALAVFDAGTGPELYVGGQFSSAGGTGASGLARWNGTSWSSPGGPTWAGGFPTVRALCVFDDGQGPALYVGGEFDGAQGVAVSRIARYDGSGWADVGGGVSGPTNLPYATVRDLAVFDPGSGPRLFASGEFTVAGGIPADHIASWDGSSWSPVGLGISESPHALAVANVGGERALFVGGEFDSAGDVPAASIGSFDGAAWSALPSSSSGDGFGAPVHALTAFDSGGGAQVYAGGTFHVAGSTAANSVARYDGTNWSALGAGVNAPVHALAGFDDGSGPSLFAGGEFTSAGGSAARHVAKWDGSTWSPLGSGTDDAVRALAVFDDGAGSALYAGGGFTTAGGVVVRHIAKWDGSNWSALGVGLRWEVRALVVFDDGTGPALYAGGFTLSGAPLTSVRRWDGSSWSGLGNGVEGYVAALTVFDDGNGAALYVGGSTLRVPGLPDANILRWDGSSWSLVGAGLDSSVVTLALFDDGRGLALFAGGQVDSSLRGLARWDGAIWSIVGQAIVGYAVYALLGFEGSGSGDRGLYVGGDFLGAGGLASARIAVWRGCEGPGRLFCSGDGGGCPCDNGGDTGRGCASSASSAGALLVSSGATNPDTLALHSSGEPSSALSVFLQGSASTAPTTFGDGLLCAGGTLLRLYVTDAVGGHAAAPRGSDPPITLRSSALGDPIASGSTRFYQTWYRDAVSSFCPPTRGAEWNVTNGVEVRW